MRRSNKRDDVFRFIVFVTHIVFVTQIFGKVLVMSHHCAQPFLVGLQARTFQKFSKDDYELVIFNDAKTAALEEEIRGECEKYGVRCIRIDQSIHALPYLKRWPREDYNHPSVRTANVVQYSLDVMGFNHPGLVVIIDSDMFPTKEFSFAQLMGERDLMGCLQCRNLKNKIFVEYLWNGLVFFNMPTLPDKRSIDFNCGFVDRVAVDTGGQTHHYLKKYRSAISFFHLDTFLFSVLSERHFAGTLEPCFSHLIPLIEKHPPLSMEVYCDDIFFHIRGGGLWETPHLEESYAKGRCVNDFINSLLET